jgi:hypothetical protein
MANWSRDESVSPAASPPHRYTEAELIRMLRQRHTRPGNGGSGEYAFLTQVRDAAGFSGSRTLDIVTLSLWPSRGMELHGYEVKVSRADWIRELHEPAKAEAFVQRLDRFSLVAADEAIVAPGELPPQWGLLAVRRGRLVTMVQAPRLAPGKEPRPVSRSWLVCLLRAAGAVPEVDPAEARAAREEGLAQGRARAEHEVESLRRVAEEERRRREEEAAARTEVFAALGIQTSHYQELEALRAIASAVRTVVAADGRMEKGRERLERLAASAEETARWLRQGLEAAAPG